MIPSRERQCYRFSVSYNTVLNYTLKSVTVLQVFKIKQHCTKLYPQKWGVTAFQYYTTLCPTIPSKVWQCYSFSMLTFTATCYLPPYTPLVGPFDPTKFKEARVFTCKWVHWTHEWHNASLFLHPFTPRVGPLDPVTCKEAAPIYWVYGSIRPTTGFHYPKS